MKYSFVIFFLFKFLSESINIIRKKKVEFQTLKLTKKLLMYKNTESGLRNLNTVNKLVANNSFGSYCNFGYTQTFKI